MTDFTKKKNSAVARYSDALARLKEEERRFMTRQKIILGGAMISMRRKNGEAGAELLRALIPHISDEDRSTVSELLIVNKRMPVATPGSPEARAKASLMRDAVAVAAAQKMARHLASLSDHSGDDEGEDTQRALGTQNDARFPGGDTP